jgi:glycine/D-amino acid oxidase-like deaminating enzyme
MEARDEATSARRRLRGRVTLAAGSRVLVVGAGIAGLAAARALARAGFAPEVIEREAQAILESIGDVHVSAIEEVALDSWVQGQVVLVGDAAHATSPNMAEGAAMAWRTRSCSRSAWPRWRRSRVGTRRSSPADARGPTGSGAQTHRRDRTRKLSPAARNLILRNVWPRIFRANYIPLLADL